MNQIKKSLAALIGMAMSGQMPKQSFFYNVPGGNGYTPKRKRTAAIRANRNRNKAQRAARRVTRHD